MTARLGWNTRVENGIEVVELVGDIDEDSDFSELVALLRGKEARLNLRGIARINSIGVREWVNFVREVGEGSKITLEECSPVVVTQLNMIANFAGAADIRSVVAPYVCDECGNEEDVLLEVAAVVADNDVLGTRPCGKCGATMELDDLPESYFAFASVER